MNDLAQQFNARGAGALPGHLGLVFTQVSPQEVRAELARSGVRCVEGVIRQIPCSDWRATMRSRSRRPPGDWPNMWRPSRIWASLRSQRKVSMRRYW